MADRKGTTERVKLTKKAVESLPIVEGTQSITWDSEISGLGVRVSPGGTRTFFYQGRLNGKVKKFTIGRLGAITADNARKEAKRIRSMLELGQDPSPAEERDKSPATFGELLQAYVALLEAQGKPSARSIRNAVERDVKAPFPKLWKKQAGKIDLDDCMKVVGRLKDAGKPRQADKLRSYIKTAYSQAINSRGNVNAPAEMRRLNLRHNPAADLTKVEGASNARDRALTLSEFRAYWQRINALPEPHRSLAVFHVLTGAQRQQQLARLTVDDIDRDAPSVTLWDTKGRRSEPRKHVVPLLPEALEAIDRITGGGDYVFSCNGGKSPVGVTFMNKLVNRVRAEMEAAGEQEKGHFTAGSIRATVETRLAAKPWRISSDVLAHLLSHGMGGVQARHYQHHDFFEEKLEALQALRRMVEGEAEPVAEVVAMRAQA